MRYSSDAGETLGTQGGVKCAGYLLANLAHTKVLLGLIIAEWNSMIVRESEDACLLVAQTPREVVYFALPQSTGAPVS